jgi:hypothetical protein
MHCSALRDLAEFPSGSVELQANRFKPRQIMHLGLALIPITPPPGFGAANALSTGNQEAAKEV